jgi:hypothetical protein
VDRTAFILVALLLGLLTACAGPERNGLKINHVEMPEWTRTGHHPDYPESDFLVAYGLARTSREAATTAEDRLEVMISDYAVRRHEGMFKDTQFEAVVTEPAAWFKLDEFGKAVQGDQASDGFEAVVARAISFNELKLRARSQLVKAKSALEKTEKPPRGLGSISMRMEKWGNYYLMAMRVVALQLIADDTLNQQVFEDVEEALISLWELPALCDVDQWGGEQHLRIREGLAGPVGLRVFFHGKPVAGVPVVWGPARGFRGTLEGDRELSKLGSAEAKVLYMASSGDEFAYVQAQFDLDRFIGRRLGIAMNVWLWKVLLPSRGNGELVVKISETEQDGQPVKEPMFTPEIKKWCEGRNLEFAEGKSSHEDKLYHLMFEGKVNVKSQMNGEIAVAVATGDFSLRDLETGEILFSYSLSLKEVGKKGYTEASVRLLALREGAAEVLVEMATRILATLPSKNDEFGTGERPK